MVSSSVDEGAALEEKWSLGGAVVWYCSASRVVVVVTEDMVAFPLDAAVCVYYLGSGIAG